MLLLVRDEQGSRVVIPHGIYTRVGTFRWAQRMYGKVLGRIGRDGWYFQGHGRRFTEVVIIGRAGDPVGTGVRDD